MRTQLSTIHNRFKNRKRSGYYQAKSHDTIIRENIEYLIGAKYIVEQMGEIADYYGMTEQQKKRFIGLRFSTPIVIAGKVRCFKDCGKLAYKKHAVLTPGLIAFKMYQSHIEKEGGDE